MTDGNTIRSVAKAMELLQLLSDAGEAMTLTAISERAGLPKSTVFGLLTTMRDYDVITQHADGKYALGLRLFEYGCRASAFWNISSLARPYLEHLAEATGASAMLSTYENGHIVALDQAEGRGSLRIVSAPGARLPLHCTSQGKIVLALHVGHSPQGLPSTGCSQLQKRTRVLCSHRSPPAARRASPWKTVSIRSVFAPSPRRCSPAAARSSTSSAYWGCSAPCTRTSSRTPSARSSPRGRCFPPHWAIRESETFFRAEKSTLDSTIVIEFMMTPCYTDKESFPMQNDLTTGSVFRNVVSFSLPYLLSYFLQTLYGMADLFIIGQFEGVASTTAVSIGSQVMHMLTVMLVGLAMGATVSIAQAAGGGDKKRTASAIGNTVTLFMLLSLALTALLLALRGGIVSIMSTPEEAVQGTLAYLTVCFIGIPFITAYNIIASIFRGLGDSKSPMYFIAVACVVNIALDYYFMGTLHLGPAGAALGTTLSQAVSVLVSLAVILKRRLMSVRRADFRPQRAVMGKLLQIGVPVALQDGFIQVSFVIITIIANRRGLTDAAAVGIVEKIIGFLFLIPSSMLSTVSALGAQNIGAGKPERARLTLRYAAMIACSFGIAVVILTLFIAEPLVGLFTPDAAVAAAGGQYLRGYIWDSFFAGVQFSFSGYFCACGKSGISFLHNSLSILLVRVPGAYLASKYFPQTLLPMGLANAAGSLFSILVCVIAYATLTRREKRAQEAS